MKQYRTITGAISLRTALHVGTGEADHATDAVCRRNSEGKWIIPGTSLAGAIRSLATRLAPRLVECTADVHTICAALMSDDERTKVGTCNCLVCNNLGFRFLDENDKDARPWASRVWIFDSLATNQGERHTRIRDGVGINRSTGAAEQGAKFDLEVVPAGTEFTFRIELEDDVDPNFEKVLAAVLAEWKHGRGSLGGRTARGLGAFTLIETRMVVRDLKPNTGLLEFLQSDRPWTGADSRKLADENWICNQIQTIKVQPHPLNGQFPESVAGSFLSVGLRLKCNGPIVVNDPAAAALAGYEFAPRIEQLDDACRFLLPGSSIRGVLRSHGEKIARTVAAHAVNELCKTPEEKLATFKTRCPACDPQQNKPQQPLVSCQSLAIHYAGETNEKEKDKTNGELGYDSERVPIGKFCPACQLFGSTYYGSRLRIEDAYSERNHHVHAQDFLKIDRFTGGGLDRAKFDAITAWEPEFAVRLYLENPADTELAWLTLILRDLRDGMLNIGFGGAKGFGRATFEEATIQIGFFDKSDLGLMLKEHGRQVLDNSASAPSESGAYRLRCFSSWDDWVELVEEAGLVARWNESITEFRRAEFKLRESDATSWRPFQLQSDSYFGVKVGDVYLSDLYPLRASPALEDES